METEFKEGINMHFEEQSLKEAKHRPLSWLDKHDSFAKFFPSMTAL